MLLIMKKNIKYLRDFFGLSIHDTLEILTVDNMPLECEENCKIGTGMKLIIDSPSNIEDSLDDIITEDDFFNEEGEVFGYEESYDSDAGVSSEESDEDDNQSEDRNQVMYYIGQ